MLNTYPIFKKSFHLSCLLYFQKSPRVSITSSSWKSVSTINYFKEITPHPLPIQYHSTSKIPKQLSHVTPFQNLARLATLSDKKASDQKTRIASHLGLSHWWVWKEKAWCMVMCSLIKQRLMYWLSFSWLCHRNRTRSNSREGVIGLTVWVQVMGVQRWLHASQGNRK